MKKLLLVLLTMSYLTDSKGQAEKQSLMTKADYLKKSKNQSTAAWVLAGGGVVMVTAGAIIGLNDATEAIGSIFTGETEKTSDAGPILFFTGAAAMVGSIPLFIASSRNKRKANDMSAFFKMENRPFVQKGSFINACFPAIGMKINL